MALNGTFITAYVFFISVDLVRLFCGQTLCFPHDFTRVQPHDVIFTSQG